MSIVRNTIYDKSSFKIYSTNTSNSIVTTKDEKYFSEFHCKTDGNNWQGSNISITGDKFKPTGIYELKLLVKWVSGFYRSAPNFIINIHQKIISTSSYYGIDNYNGSELVFFSTNGSDNGLISNDFKEVIIVINFDSKTITTNSSYFNGNNNIINFSRLNTIDDLVFQIGIGSYGYISDLSLKDISIKRNGVELFKPYKELMIISGRLGINFDNSNLIFDSTLEKTIGKSPKIKIYKNEITEDNLLIDKIVLGGE